MSDKDARDAAQIMIVGEGFRIAQRLAQACQRADEVLIAAKDQA